MNDLIKWEKYIDPIDEAFEVEEIYEKSNDIYEDCEDEDVDVIAKNVKLFKTQQGFVPISRTSSLGSRFNLHTAHFSERFDYKGDPIIRAIKRVKGVEKLDRISPYRIMIGIAKFYDTKEEEEEIKYQIYKAAKIALEKTKTQSY